MKKLLKLADLLNNKALFEEAHNRNTIWTTNNKQCYSRNKKFI